MAAAEGDKAQRGVEEAGSSQGGGGEGGGGAPASGWARAGSATIVPTGFLKEYGYEHKPRRSSLTHIEGLHVDQAFLSSWGFTSKKEALNGFDAAERLIGQEEVGNEALRCLDSAERLLLGRSPSEGARVEGVGGHNKGDSMQPPSAR